MLLKRLDSFTETFATLGTIPQCTSRRNLGTFRKLASASQTAGDAFLVSREEFERINQEGRDFVSATALLNELVQHQGRCERYLQMLLGWYQRHQRGKFLQQLRNRFMNPRSLRESKKETFARWDKEVMAFLDNQYPNAPNYKASLASLWKKYLALEMPNEHFVKEFTSGKKPAVFQRAWEMMLARHLDAQGYQISTSDEGPDFRFEHNGRRIWVEAVSPEPAGVPDHYLEHPKRNEFKVGDVPHNEVLLRWTAAIKEKWNKLKHYRVKGIVGENDGYVIAVNGCQLGAFPLQHGVSRLPYALEAVYPVGPVAIPIDKATGKIGQAFVSERRRFRTPRGRQFLRRFLWTRTMRGLAPLLHAQSTDRRMPSCRWMSYITILPARPFRTACLGIRGRNG